ncbi:hypothetical protein MYAER_0433 [Microcystis aeruginosa NIES-2549]|uniref:Uncharacterized protein n=1 Tax=Microcystis aeruginosa NIES-2549 TaxID=1641812 RepID=A0A0F6RJC2_MICAE|nr:hypothetical protein MYAER_0433 [Microcystis aeruginosa NIES-2549]
MLVSRSTESVSVLSIELTSSIADNFRVEVNLFSHRLPAIPWGNSQKLLKADD